MKRINSFITKRSRKGGSSAGSTAQEGKADANGNIPMAVAVPADDCLDTPVVEAEAVAVPVVPKVTQLSGGSTLSAGESKVSDPDIETLIGLQKLEPFLELQKYLVDLIKKFTQLYLERKSQHSFNERLERKFYDRIRIFNNVSDPNHIEELIVLVRQKPAFCCTEPFLEKI